MNFDFDYDLSQAIKQHEYKEIERSYQRKKLSLVTCRLVILKKLIDNQNLNISGLHFY